MLKHPFKTDTYWVWQDENQYGQCYQWSYPNGYTNASIAVSNTTA